MPRQTTPDLKPHFQTVYDLDDYLTDGVIDWEKFFGNSHPVEVDIGCGRGLFTFTAAVENPQVNYLGIELAFKEGRRAARRLLKHEVLNARILGCDARDVLSKMVRPGSLSAAHVYFPDPWWKRRHKHRRIFTDTFADLIARVLKPGGMLHHWTDVEDYFEVVAALMQHHPLFDTLTPPAEKTPEHDMDYRTSFERKKRQEGETIYRGQWQRKADTPPA